MSPTFSSEEHRSGIKGKRIAGRPGRFDPDRPLHMTTRGAAKKYNPNGESSSVNGSTRGSESRRGSFEEARPTTSHSIASQHSAYDAMDLDTVNVEVSPAVPEPETVFETHDYSIGLDGNPCITVETASSPSRKRKRSSPTVPSTPTGLFVGTAETPGSVPVSDGSDHIGLSDMNGIDEGDFVEVVDPSLLSDRERSGSSSESGDAIEDDMLLVVPSVDVTPTVSVPHSPPSSMSASQDGITAKEVDIALEPTEQSDEGEGEVLEDGEETGELDGIDGVDEADGNGRAKRRWGGRKRQCHPERKVELAMQRQLHLKKAYRTIAREMKVIASDIAKRTLDELDNNPRCHEQAAEYPIVKSELEDSLERRRALVQTQHRLDAEHLRKRLEAEQQVLSSGHKLDLRNLQDRYLDRLEHQVLLIARSAHLAENSAGHETDAEGEIAPRPKRMGYKFKRGAALDPQYDSRSLQVLEEERATEDLYRRMKMRKMLADLGTERPALAGGFTVMDSTARNAAQTKREGIALTTTLGEAANEVERRSLLMVPNEAAAGLQMLGDLALRPSLRADVRSRKDPPIAQTPPRRHAPPPIAIPTANDHTVPVELSPRTNRLIGDRFDFPQAMPPPPQTPREVLSGRGEQRPVPPLASPYSRSEAPVRPSQPGDRPLGRDLQPRSKPSPFYQLNSFSDWPEHRKVDGLDSRETTREPPARRSPLWPDLSRTSASIIDPQMFGVNRRASSELADRAAFPGFRAASATSFRPLEPWHSERPSGVPEPTNNCPPSPKPQMRPGNGPDTAKGVDLFRHHSVLSNGLPSLHSRKPASSGGEAKSSTTKTQAESTAGDSDNNQRRLSENRPFWKKTNKEERGGQSRRASRQKGQKHNRPQSLGDALPITAASRPSSKGAAHSPTDLTPSSSLPPPPPAPLLPLGPYRQQLHNPRPSQPLSQSSQAEAKRPQTTQQQQHHRNSFPPLQPPPPGWTPATTNPSPIYAIAPPSTLPPPGINSEHYTHTFTHFPPPPPPLHFQPPRPPPRSSSSSSSSFPQHQVPHPPPPPHQYNQQQQHQFGGQPIAPANPEIRHHQPGFPPGGSSMPAFAQRHIDGSGSSSTSSSSSRRRTQSDVLNSTRRWQHWEPGQSNSGPQRKR